MWIQVTCWIWFLCLWIWYIALRIWSDYGSSHLTGLEHEGFRLELRRSLWTALVAHLYPVLSNSSILLSILLWKLFLRSFPARVASVQNGIRTNFMLFSTATLASLHLLIRLGCQLMGAMVTSLIWILLFMLLPAEHSFFFWVLHESLNLGFGEVSWWGSIWRCCLFALWWDVTKGVLWEDLRFFFEAFLKTWWSGFDI